MAEKDILETTRCPRPRTTLLLGNLHQLSAGYRTLSPVDQYREWTRRFGPIYGVQFGGTPMLVISDLEMAHEVLTNKFSLFHQRKAVRICLKFCSEMLT